MIFKLIDKLDVIFLLYNTENMPDSVKAYASKTAKAPLRPFEITRRDLRPDDVKIKITYCGICHSDLHQANDDLGGSSNPVVPGHEIVGHVG